MRWQLTVYLLFNLRNVRLEETKKDREEPVRKAVERTAPPPHPVVLQENSELPPVLSTPLPSPSPHSQTGANTG